MKNSKRMIIITIIFSIIGVCVLSYLYVLENKESKRLKELQEVVAPIEREIDSKKSEIQTLKKNKFISDQGISVISFYVHDISELETVDSLANKYHFKPVLLIDSNISYDLLFSIYDYEIIFTQELSKNPSLDFYNQNSMNMNCDSFILRAEDDTEQNIEKLKSSFKTVIRHSSMGENCILKNGMRSLNYSFVRENSSSLDKRISSLVANRQSMVFVFELKENSKNEIEEQLKLINQNVESALLKYGTISSVEKALDSFVSNSKKNEKQIDEKVAAIQQEIDELENQVRDIYNGSEVK